MRVIYLDQNKWIEFARAAKSPDRFPEKVRLLEGLFGEVAAHRIVVPLSFANIYETQKINDRTQRHELASLQASLSSGKVFRGRYRRLEIELHNFVRSVHGQPPEAHPDKWFLSEIFLEAVAGTGDERIPSIPQTVTALIQSRPAEALYDFVMNTPEDVRRFAVMRFSEGAEQLRQRIESRRTQHAKESLAMRRRIYSALLMIDELELILRYSRAAGADWNSASDIGSSIARRMMIEVPIYHIEREITLRLEDQNRAVTENDFRDMQAFGAVVAYADHVVAENQFSNLAIQAGLDKKYGTSISTNILSLQGLIQTPTETRADGC